MRVSIARLSQSRLKAQFSRSCQKFCIRLLQLPGTERSRRLRGLHVPAPIARVKSPMRKGATAVPAFRMEGIAAMMRTMWATKQMRTPIAIVLNRPSFVSAIQPPKIGMMYARKPKSNTKAFANCKPLPRAPADSCVPLGVAPVPEPGTLRQLHPYLQ